MYLICFVSPQSFAKGLANAISSSRLQLFPSNDCPFLSGEPFPYIFENREKKIMNLTGKGASNGDKKLSSSKATLNPNAKEFVPFALRSQAAAGISISDASSKFATSLVDPPGKPILDRSESLVSSKSDEEAQQYWRHQLPDDITPDFNVTGLDDTQEINGLSFSGLSLTEVDERPRFTSSTSSGFISKQQSLSPHPLNGDHYAENRRYDGVSSYREYPSPDNFQPSLAKPWEKQIFNNDQLLARQGHPYVGNAFNLSADLENEQLLMDEEDVGPFEFLALQFPGFAAESLAEVYLANGGDLNLTIEMLSQLELQVEVDEGLNQTLNSKALSTPNLSALAFPSLSLTDGQNGLAKFAGNDHRSVSPYRSPEKDNTHLFRSFSSIPSRGNIDFASAVNKMPPRDPSIWSYDKKGSLGTSTGSSRSSQVMGSLYNGGQGRGIYGNILPNRGSAHASPVWLETGEAVANMYSGMREEARDHARVRNAYFEQARQAYLIGNKTLAKELSMKGQMYDMQMKAAHGKDQESIFCQRNTEMHTNERELMIDLHGLHVNEAIHVLKHELAILKITARSANQRMLAYICVGTGHHTKGSRTPARLQIAVQRYLLEEEGLDYTEPQPGLIRVVIF